MPACHNCGSFVTSEFARVFGNNDGDVFGCPECMSLGLLMRGVSARQEP